MRTKQNLSNLFKILTMLVVVFSIMITSKPKIFAASATISCPTEGTVGEPITISVNGSGVQWNLNLAVNGSIIARSSEMENYQSNKTISFSATYTPTSAGTLNISLINSSVTENDDLGTTITNFESRTINVKEPDKPNENPDPQPPANETTGGNENQGGDNQGGNQGNENQGGNQGGENQGGENQGGNSGGPTPSGNEQDIPHGNGGNQNQDQPSNKSKNDHLSTLNVDIGTLSPSFNRDRTDYTISFPDDYNYKELHTFRITASAEDNRARVEGAGVVTVEEGENTFEIKCTSEDGTVRTYRIKVNKPVELKQSDLRLKGLKINMIDDKGVFTEKELGEEFDPEKFSYRFNVDSNITDLDIKAETENTDIKIEIEGGKDLGEGENIVTITLISPTDDNVKTVYTLKVNKEKAVSASSNTIEQDYSKIGTTKRKKNLLPIITVVVVILSAAVVALLIINNRHNDDDEYISSDEEEKEGSYLKNENLEKLSKRFETAEKVEEEKEELFDNPILTDSVMKKEPLNSEEESRRPFSSEINDNMILTDEVQKPEEPEFKRELTINPDNLTEREIKREVEAERQKENRINKLDELMEKNATTKKTTSKTKDTKNAKFSKEEFFKDINEKKGKHF